MEFRSGMKLEAIFWSESGAILEVGDRSDQPKSITVVMENGQMASVAWALAEFNDGGRAKFNLAMCKGVVLLEDGEQQ